MYDHTNGRLREVHLTIQIESLSTFQWPPFYLYNKKKTLVQHTLQNVETINKYMVMPDFVSFIGD